MLIRCIVSFIFALVSCCFVQLKICTRPLLGWCLTREGRRRKAGERKLGRDPMGVFCSLPEFRILVNLRTTAIKCWSNVVLISCFKNHLLVVERWYEKISTILLYYCFLDLCFIVVILIACLEMCSLVDLSFYYLRVLLCCLLTSILLVVLVNNVDKSSFLKFVVLSL